MTRIGTASSCALLLTCSCLLSSNPTALLVLQPGPAVVARGLGRAVGSPGGLYRGNHSCGGVKRSWCGVPQQHHQQQQQQRRRTARTSTSRCSMINNIFDTRARSQVGGWVGGCTGGGCLVRSVLVSNSVRDMHDTSAVQKCAVVPNNKSCYTLCVCVCVVCTVGTLR